MSPAEIERSIQNAVASLEMEGFSVDADCAELCRLLPAGGDLRRSVTAEEVR